MTRVTIQVFPGFVAVAAAHLLSGAVWATIATLVLLVIAYDPRPRVRATVLLAAPVVLSLGTQLPSLYALRALAWVAIAFLAASPFFIAFGDAVPWRRLPLFLVAVLTMVTAVVAFRWGPTWLASDIAARGQVLLMAAASLVVWSVVGVLKWTAVRTPARQVEPQARRL